MPLLTENPPSTAEAGPGPAGLHMPDIAPPPAATDEDLARRAAAGCMASFEQLVRRYQVPLLHFLLRRGTRRCDAEDILQESFLRAYHSLDRYRPKWPFRTWIFTLTCRQAVSQRRKATRQRGDVDISHAAARCSPPEMRLMEDESRGRLWDMAREILSDEQVCALWLHYVEATPATQIARILGRSWVWVKTNLHRARKKLGQRILADGAIRGGRL
jgi:RNA polymerase sigma-70 factor (ECF subfamily)